MIKVIKPDRKYIEIYFKTFTPAAAAPVRLRTSTAPEVVNFDHEDKKGTRSYENVDHHP